MQRRSATSDVWPKGFFRRQTLGFTSQLITTLVFDDNMGDHDNPSTCLSSNPHSHHVRDIFLHYSGCLRENERDEFFKSLKPYKQKRIEREEQRIQSLRLLFEKEEKETKGLAKKFMTSLNDWRIEYWDKYPTRRITPPTTKRETEPAFNKPDKKNGFDLFANMILFRDSLPWSDTGSLDKFPNQKISIQSLLYEKDISKNPLMRQCEKNEIRYFHLPGNNMEWVEEAIARHYNEERPEYDGLFRRPENPSKTYMLLRPEFWRGQQHGGRHDAVHARHLRPRCDMISTDPENLEDTPKNLVLFMPYLHWETDRRRSHFEEIMRNLTEKHRKAELQEAQNAYKTNAMVMTGTNNKPSTSAASESSQEIQRDGTTNGSIEHIAADVLEQDAGPYLSQVSNEVLQLAETADLQHAQMPRQHQPAENGRAGNANAIPAGFNSNLQSHEAADQAEITLAIEPADD